MVIPTYYTGLPEGVCLNEMQELLVPHMDNDYNIVVAAPTASGKSQAITMFGHKYLQAKKRVCYIGIMRALAQEKADDWAEDAHPWKRLNKTVISGDYKMDAVKQAEIDKANVICITPESLASRLRHPHSQRNQFLSEIGLLVVDEAHLLSADNRGTNMEAALIEFTYEFPDVQIVALSATMPNVHDIGAWLTVLNKKHTEVIVSDYRPVELNKHYERTYESGAENTERERIEMIAELVESKPDQQFMVAVWKKTFGRKIEDHIKSLKIPCAFHNANHDKITRRSIEQSFKSGQLRVLVSTSTLFTGVNLPARNVIITAVQVGQTDIPVYELQQAMGRAGRPRYDTEGDVYLQIPAGSYNRHVRRIEAGEPIVSHMAEKEWLAMHFLGALYLGRVHNAKEFGEWFDRTLAQFQQKMTAASKRELLAEVLADMRTRRMVLFDDYTKEFRLAHRGKIAAQMYLEPYHFSDLLYNLRKYFSLTQPNDLDLAVAMGACYGYADPSVSVADKDAIPQQVLARPGMYKDYLKAISVIWYRIHGEPVPNILSSNNFAIFEDMPRLHAATVRAYEEVERWPDVSADQLDIAFTRVIMRCTRENAEFGLKKFTRKERKLLNAIGLYSFRDAQLNLGSVIQVIPFERCVELGLARAGGSVPQPRAIGAPPEEPNMNARQAGFVGRRGFGKKQ